MLTELNHRIDGGIEVSLLWNSASGETFIEVCDLREDEATVFPISGEHASDAFMHPFAYLYAKPGNSYPVAA